MHTVSFVIDAVIAAGSLLGWFMILTGEGDDRQLAARGRASLKYFTVLSNLLSGMASACWLLAGASATAPAPWLVVLRLVATSAVMLTFLTVIGLLGPTLGWKNMFSGGNLLLHLALPLLAAIDFVLLVPTDGISLAATAFAMVPTALYTVWYLHMVRPRDGGDDGRNRDFYGFLRWGWERVPLVIAVMHGLTWAIGVALLVANRALCLV